MMNFFLRYSLLVPLLLVSFFSFSKQPQIPVEHFSKNKEFNHATISPGGEYLAVINKVAGKNALVIFDTENFKMLHAVAFEGNAQVGDYHWVNNERVVVTKEYLKGWQDHPEYHGEIFGVNANGARGKYLIGYHGEMQTGTRLKRQTPLYGTSFVLDPLVTNKRKMLVVTYPWTSSNEPHTIVYEVDVYTGKRKQVTLSPSRMAEFLTDHDGNVRVSVSTDNYIDAKIHTKEKEGGDWKKLNLGEVNYGDIRLRAFDKSGDSIYMTASVGGEAEGLYKLNLNTKEIELVHQEQYVSPKRVWVDEASKELFAIESELGYPNYAFIDKDSHKSVRLKSLIEALQGDQVQLVSSTSNGDINVIYASSDTNPGKYYLYDGVQNKLRILFSARGWLNENELSKTKPIQYKTRDGLTIYGYLTVPNGLEDKNLPLVVMPHGGPHGPRDYWGYDSEVQLLASRGMAVLRVNFRGSGGFGRNFEEAGYQKWGSDIQFDIIDGVKFLISNGTVNKNNICIMGSSFGAYSALQSAILEPDMFKCAIGTVGIYDLPLMFEEGDISGRSTGQNYLENVLGTDETLLKAFSPSYNIDKLKAAVFIVHAGEDARAPIEQAESLIAALKKANHPYKYVLLEDEGHGFYKEEHRTAYYKQVINFLDKHLEL